MTPFSPGSAAALSRVTARGNCLASCLATFPSILPTSARVFSLKHKSDYNPLLKNRQWLPTLLIISPNSWPGLPRHWVTWPGLPISVQLRL